MLLILLTYLLMYLHVVTKTPCYWLNSLLRVTSGYPYHLRVISCHAVRSLDDSFSLLVDRTSNYSVNPDL